MQSSVHATVHGIPMAVISRDSWQEAHGPQQDKLRQSEQIDPWQNVKKQL